MKDIRSQVENTKAAPVRPGVGCLSLIAVALISYANCDRLSSHAANSRQDPTFYLMLAGGCVSVLVFYYGFITVETIVKHVRQGPDGLTALRAKTVLLLRRRNLTVMVASLTCVWLAVFAVKTVLEPKTGVSFRTERLTVAELAKLEAEMISVGGSFRDSLAARRSFTCPIPETAAGRAFHDLIAGLYADRLQVALTLDRLVGSDPLHNGTLATDDGLVKARTWLLELRSTFQSEDRHTAKVYASARKFIIDLSPTTPLPDLPQPVEFEGLINTYSRAITFCRGKKRFWANDRLNFPNEVDDLFFDQFVVRAREGLELRSVDISHK